MALIVVKGDLLASDCDVLCHQCNCFATMGAGIAKQFAHKWPAVLRADQQYMPNAPINKLGKVSRALVEQNTIFVYNLYGQYQYGRNRHRVHGEDAALQNAITMMLEELKQLPTFKSLKIGMPYAIGCGLAGGDWPSTQRMLNNLSIQYGVDFYLYQLDVARS